MPSSNVDRPLRPVSYTVLGLLATVGPQTSYELEQNFEASVSFFWHVTRSQLYAEPQRLVGLGLVSSTQESTGRRRRTFTITEDGHRALVQWLTETPEPSQYRDPAMLRLFFMDAAPSLITSLAQSRIRELTETLRFLEQPGLGGARPSHQRVLSWGRMTVGADLAFWQSVLDDSERQS
ncbi:PadR family transcriptional regulator [Microbacterium jiangjiandongii]|uniref:PadR family transcriptional regulator n=1 Tax=Microbacterium jiangjiandongii TaxID=3049071 RepID=UPI00214B5C32|nr:PadR family transcriptional regulator [Microbacterium sp. zg.Y843]MCR2816583.1 PadR family transcriptional regulator [Microbacterium sp. zg.Y843]